LRLSLATIALNEQDLIGGMLSSVAGLVDDVVIGIDDKTTDDTAAIVEAAGGKTFLFRWSDDFAAARNLTLDRVTGDWVLVIDPDERLTLGGRFLVQDVLKRIPEADPSIDGFCFECAQLDMDRKFQLKAKTSVRLFRCRSNIRYKGVVHEELWAGNDPLRHLMVAGLPAIEHFGYSPERWIGRGKHALYQRLLEKRVAENPADAYAYRKLVEESRMNAEGMVIA
jgi:glycosyltransferase involved in cell wall biosynthesis